MVNKTKIDKYSIPIYHRAYISQYFLYMLFHILFCNLLFRRFIDRFLFSTREMNYCCDWS